MSANTTNPVSSNASADPVQDALSRFEPATAELLASRALQKRVDSKFLFSRATLPALLRALADDFHVVLSAEERAANYASLYFDTDDRAFFHAHRRGGKPRHKVRVRHYVERDLCFLETKTKTKYGVTQKSRRLRAPRDFALSDDDRAWIEAAIGPTATLSPSCWIHFPRVTLVGVHHEERLTLDLGLTFDQHDEPVGFDGAVIAEVKQPRFAPRSPAMRALRGVGARRRRVSKYCSGIALLEPTRRTHAFRPTLRDLHRMDDARSLP